MDKKLKFKNFQVTIQVKTVIVDDAHYLNLKTSKLLFKLLNKIKDLSI